MLLVMEIQLRRPVGNPALCLPLSAGLSKSRMPGGEILRPHINLFGLTQPTACLFQPLEQADLQAGVAQRGGSTQASESGTDNGNPWCIVMHMSHVPGLERLTGSHGQPQDY